jgi:hypothetical protein
MKRLSDFIDMGVGIDQLRSQRIIRQIQRHQMR